MRVRSGTFASGSDNKQIFNIIFLYAEPTSEDLVKMEFSRYLVLTPAFFRTTHPSVLQFLTSPIFSGTRVVLWPEEFVAKTADYLEFVPSYQLVHSYGNQYKGRLILNGGLSYYLPDEEINDIPRVLSAFAKKGWMVPSLEALPFIMPPFVELSAKPESNETEVETNGEYLAPPVAFPNDNELKLFQVPIAAYEASTSTPSPLAVNQQKRKRHEFYQSRLQSLIEEIKQTILTSKETEIVLDTHTLATDVLATWPKVFYEKLDQAKKPRKQSSNQSQQISHTISKEEDSKRCLELVASLVNEALKAVKNDPSISGKKVTYQFSSGKHTQIMTGDDLSYRRSSSSSLVLRLGGNPVALDKPALDPYARVALSGESMEVRRRKLNAVSRPISKDEPRGPDTHKPQRFVPSKRTNQLFFDKATQRSHLPETVQRRLREKEAAAAMRANKPR